MSGKNSKRKSISKKLRFEIFKRDGFTCGYCGNKPPKVILEVDHIDPIANGGKSDINNYLTACFDCNRGKGAALLSKTPNQLDENLEILKEKDLQIKEYQKFVSYLRKKINRDVRNIEKVFQEVYPENKFSKMFKQTSVKVFLKSLPKREVEEAMYIAISKIDDDFYRAIRYFCGICWRKIRND